MDRVRFHMFTVATLFVLLVGFYILLSPSLKDVRVAIGLPEKLPGSRYNEDINGVEIVNEGFDNFYLGRVAFVYHSVFILFLYASVTIFGALYLRDQIQRIVLDLSCIAAIIVAVSAVLYNYGGRDFFWHGTFLAGLSLFFFVGILILLNFKPKNLLEWNIWLSGVLLLIGGVWGAWLGASFMHFRDEYIEALIKSRFNPDLAEENIFWRALTSHEHAMIAIALTLVFLLALSIAGVEEDAAFMKIFTAKRLYYLALIVQLVMAIAAYAVTFVGKIAHLIITPAAMLLIFATLLLSIIAKKDSFLRVALIVGNVAMWVAVALPGAIVAINLRKAVFLPLPFRDPLYDWAELAYNIGHWHLLLFSWGVILLIIYMYWPENFLEKYTYVKWISWLVLIAYFVAMVGTNLYMLANPPMEYVPNPYDNVWVKFIMEPSLIVITIGVAISYLIYLYEYGITILKSIPKILKGSPQ